MSSPTDPAMPPPERDLPWRGLCIAAAAALLLHMVLLGWLPLGLGKGQAGGVAPVLSVRQVKLLPAAPAAESPPAAPAPARRRARPGDSPPEPAAETPPAEPAPTPTTAPVVVAEAEPAASAPASAPTAVAEAEDPSAASAAAAALPEGGGKPIPTYATRRPAGVVMQFELRRGGLTGNGELVWQPTPEGYTLMMNGTAFGLPVIGWSSQGGFDVDGLAPERFVDQRRARDVRAANFQRDKGRITYSGPSIEHPLVPGSQDRLSWMLQLPAIVAAEPQAFDIGARISMFVAGARGDADVWTFSIEAKEAVEVIEGRVEGAWRLLREPRKAFDTRVEVWLDPAREYLPVRLRLTQPNSGDSYEFSLRRINRLP